MLDLLGRDVPYKDKFFGNSKKFMEYYKTKFTRPVAYHIAGAAACIETYILAMQAAKSIKAEAVRDALAAADLRDLLQPHQVHARGRRRCHHHGGDDRPGEKGKLEIVFPGEAHSAARSIRRHLGQKGVISCLSLPSSYEGRCPRSGRRGHKPLDVRAAHDPSGPLTRKKGPPPHFVGRKCLGLSVFA